MCIFGKKFNIYESVAKIKDDNYTGYVDIRYANGKIISSEKILTKELNGRYFCLVCPHLKGDDCYIVEVFERNGKYDMCMVDEPEIHEALNQYINDEILDNDEEETDDYDDDEELDDDNNERMDAYDAIIDEDNEDNVFMYDDNGDEIEFEQIYTMPLNNRFFVILKPVKPFEDTEENEAYVFELTNKNNNKSVSVITDEKIIDKVFKEFHLLLDETLNSN